MFFVFIIGGRVYTYNEAYDRDTPSYAVLARGMTLGKTLYVDLWEHRPPATFWTYEFAMFVVGYGRQQMFFLGVLSATAVLLAIFFSIRRLGGNLTSAVWAAGLWAILSMYLPLQANIPNAEAFMNICSTVPFMLLLAPNWRSGAAWRVIAIGLLFTLNSFYKPITVPLTILLAAVHTLLPPPGVPRKRAAMEVAAMVMVAILCWGGYIAYLHHTGVWPAFWEANVDFNRVYSATWGSKFPMLMNVLRGFYVAPSGIRWSLWWLAPATLAASAVAAFAAQPLSLRGRSMLAALCVGSFIAMAAPGNYNAHYFQLLVPSLCIGVGLLWQCSARRWGPLFAQGCRAAMLLVVGLLVMHTLRFFAYPISAWPALKYGTRFEIDCVPMAARLDKLLRPDETFFEWGTEPQLYFYAGRQQPCPVLCDMVLSPLGYRGPWVPRMIKDTITALDSANVELIVVRRRSLPLPPELAQWIRARYRLELPTGNPSFVMYARRNGRLEAEANHNRST